MKIVIAVAALLSLYYVLQRARNSRSLEELPRVPPWVYRNDLEIDLGREIFRTTSARSLSEYVMELRDRANKIAFN